MWENSTSNISYIKSGSALKVLYWYVWRLKELNWLIVNLTTCILQTPPTLLRLKNTVVLILILSLSKFSLKSLVDCVFDLPFETELKCIKWSVHYIDNGGLSGLTLRFVSNFRSKWWFWARTPITVLIKPMACVSVLKDQCLLHQGQNPSLCLSLLSAPLSHFRYVRYLLIKSSIFSFPVWRTCTKNWFRILKAFSTLDTEIWLDGPSKVFF